MPSKSAKEKLLDIKATEALRDIEIIEDVCPDQMDSGVDEILDDFIEDAIAIYSCRRGISIGVPKSIDWRNNILSSFGDGRFKQMLRVSKYQFANMVNLIKADEVFSTAAERQQLVERTFEELPHCLGYIDGSEIKLFEKPAKCHEVYFSRQRIYSVKLQVVCDYKLRIRNAVIGSPGSYHD
ncbi:hypothetical protein ACLKA6_007290 [Drosophila palustris]